jgi:hypothetical protein
MNVIKYIYFYYKGFGSIMGMRQQVGFFMGIPQNNKRRLVALGSSSALTYIHLGDT